jgi:ABC-type phosphate transport system substrate-binding protein
VKETLTFAGPPSAINLNAKEVSRLFGGDIAKWNDAELAATVKGLGKCSAAVTRIVRQDKSGTTNIFKQYLIRAENERTGQKCAELKKWEAYFKENTEWPGLQKKGEEGTCSEIKHPEKSGGKEVIELVKATEASVGYADLADAVGKGLLLPNVENATGTSPQAPNAGKGANCTYSVLSLPGSSVSDAVGLNSEDNWANNNEEHAAKPANHENAADLGSKYPICGITFDLVYEKEDGLESLEPEVTEKSKVVKGLISTKNILVGGPVAGAKIPVGTTVAKIVSETEVELSAAVEGAGTAAVKESVQFSDVKNPVSRLTADQRRTMYSYFTMILSSVGQDVLSSNNYAPLPSTWLTKLRTGFQENF